MIDNFSDITIYHLSPDREQTYHPDDRQERQVLTTEFGRISIHHGRIILFSEMLSPRSVHVLFSQPSSKAHRIYPRVLNERKIWYGLIVILTNICTLLNCYSKICIFAYKI